MEKLIQIVKFFALAQLSLIALLIVVFFCTRIFYVYKENRSTTFYDTFLSSNNAIKMRFAQTDFSKQKHLLKQGLNMIIMFAGNSPIAKSAIEKLTVSHDHNHLNIEPSMYAYWVDSLMVSIKIHDKNYTPELEKQWRDVVALGINQMKSGY